MMVPGGTRFDECAAKHIMKNESAYIGRGLTGIRVEAVDDIPGIVASRVITWGQADPHGVLILPTSPAKLLDTTFPCHPREEINRLQMFRRFYSLYNSS
jgi:hypothetical protein